MLKSSKENPHELCRICGKDGALPWLDGCNPFAKREYKDIFREVYSLNMDEDNEEVPPFICRDGCRKNLQADILSLKAFKQEKKGSGSKKPSKVICSDFEPHELSITLK